MEAHAAQAVVLLALHGGMGENGFVQAFLQGYRVPFTGPAWDAANIAIDKVTSPTMSNGGCAAAQADLCSMPCRLVLILTRFAHTSAPTELFPCRMPSCMQAMTGAHQAARQGDSGHHASEVEAAC